MTEPNKSIKRIHHVIPTIDDIKYKVNGAVYFSKIDLNKGYHQLELEPNSRNITTFSTHLGFARYKRLNFGCKSATEIFHETIRQKLVSVNGALNIHDDILIYGRNKEEHHKNLKKVLDILKRWGLTANSGKCEFFASSIKFYGLIFTSDGVSPDPAKVEALRNAKAPASKRELKSFLGMTNYIKYSDHTVKLRKLLHDSSQWEWTDGHENAFQVLKDCLKDSCMLHYFEPQLETHIICDASPFGLGATLVQIKDEEQQIVAYASRALTKTEQNYGHIEREALAILFGCLKFQTYVLGHKFVVITDHLPLVPCFNNPKSQMPYRIERIRMKLQGFDFSGKYCPGYHNISDFISRHINEGDNELSKEEKDIIEHVHTLLENTFDCVSLQELREAVSADPVISKIINMVQKGKIVHDEDCNVKRCVTIFKELYTTDNLLMRRDRIVIPESLRTRIIHCGHDGHQGIVKTKQLLRSKYWWPSMDLHVQTFIENCRACQASVLKSEKEPLKMTPLPPGPWENVATDFHGPLASGEYLLVVIDEYSRFPVVEIVNSTSYKTVAPKYDKIFAEFGIPKNLKSDNGPPFTGYEFKNFSKYMGFHHQRITPLHPESNGLVEKFNAGLGKIIHTAKVEGKNWRVELQSYLRNYRATPHLTTNETPANLLFQHRNFRVRLPEMFIKPHDKQLRKTDTENKNTIKFYADKKNNVKYSDLRVGDKALVKVDRKSKSDPYYDPNAYTVVEKKGNMIVAKNGLKTVTRNTSFFKKIPSTDENIDDKITDRDDEILENHDQGVLRRSTRARGEPVRYPLDVRQ